MLSWICVSCSIPSPQSLPKLHTKPLLLQGCHQVKSCSNFQEKLNPEYNQTILCLRFHLFCLIYDWSLQKDIFIAFFHPNFAQYYLILVDQSIQEPFAYIPEE